MFQPLKKNGKRNGRKTLPQKPNPLIMEKNFIA
jgi:hypothetical protein